MEDRRRRLYRNISVVKGRLIGNLFLTRSVGYEANRSAYRREKFETTPAALEAGRPFELRKRIGPRDASHGHEVVVRCFRSAFCSQSLCARLSVSLAFVRPGLNSTSRMTGKPCSRATPLLPLLVVVCHLALGRACTPAVIFCPHESPDYDAAYRTAPSSPLQKLTTEEFEGSLAQFNVTEPIVTEDVCIEDLRVNKVSPLSPTWLPVCKGMLVRALKRKGAEERNGRLAPGSYCCSIVREAAIYCFEAFLF